VTSTTVTTKEFPRVEAASKVTGAALYTADHHRDGMLYAVLVGAPVAAGRLPGVDTLSGWTRRCATDHN